MARIGIFGGGPLAKMIAQAASVLGIETLIFARQADEPALSVTPHQIIGDWADLALLRQFADSCDVVTIEDDQVELDLLRQIVAWGRPVWPHPDTLAQVQDKLEQARRMQQLGIDTARFRKVSVPTDVLDSAAEFGFPIVLRSRRKGPQASIRINRAAGIQPALEKLAGQDLMVEAAVPIVRELAVIITRDAAGEMRTYPVVQTIRRNNTLHTALCPAPIDEATAYRAIEVARKAVESIEGVGSFGVALFEIADQEVLLHRVAPYPHNAGLYSIEGIITSQFENHVRAIMGYPLGDVAQIAPATVMINILAERDGLPNPEAIREALATEGVHYHMYGKYELRIGRKMGHINILGYDVDSAEKLGRFALSRLNL